MQERKKIYIVGIEGAGTSALAMLYKNRGHHVSGSDDGDGFYRENLERMGIEVFHTFSAEHITDDIDLVVYSTAFLEGNGEVSAAKGLGLDMLSYPEAISKLTEDSYTFAVCGTHGKTTTTGLLTHALIGAGRDPAAIVGAPVVGWSGGARAGQGEELVIEADEYQNKLALYSPQAVVLTGVDYDHPDFFVDFDAYKKVFTDFVARIPRTGLLVVNGDDHDAVKVAAAASCRTLQYGEGESCEARIKDREEIESGQEVSVIYKNVEYTIKTKLHGKHNAMNAVAAWVMSAEVTGDALGSIEGILSYQGVKRRFESHGAFRGAVMIDDYAHHPEEVRTTLATVRELYPEKRIVAAFHPHTFSRTEALLEEFARALDIADTVIVLDIYTSAREKIGTVNAQDLADAVNQNAQQKAQNIHTIEELVTWTHTNLGKNDVFITLGAGDIWKVHEVLAS